MPNEMNETRTLRLASEARHRSETNRRYVMFLVHGVSRNLSSSSPKCI
jgi:hypothetical protein